MSADVHVRSTTQDDLPILFLQQCDPEATRMAAWPPRDHDAFMDHWDQVLADTSVIKQTIIVDGQVAGYIVSFDMSGERQVGYWIGRDYWGRGIATKGLELFLRQEPARPLHAHVAKDNVGSIRVLEKCGFRVVREEKGQADGVEEWIMALGPADANAVHIVPNLLVRDGKAAVAFYTSAFGAVEHFRAESPDGTIFAEMSIQGARFFVADESARCRNFSPSSLGGTSVRIDLLVDDPDAVQARAVKAGAKEISPVTDEAVGPRMGRIEDPFGHCWLIGSHWTGGTNG